MAIQTPPSATGLLTYEQYMVEPETEGSYYITDGVRTFMAGASWQHQRISRKFTFLLSDYEESTGSGYMLYAPFDILIQRRPLRTRQPDLFFITHARLQAGGGIPAHGPVEVGPELVIEILSDSDRRAVIASKLADYAAVGVREAWLVDPDARTLEMRLLTTAGFVTHALYNANDVFVSPTFPDLHVTLATVFQP